MADKISPTPYLSTDETTPLSNNETTTCRICMELVKESKISPCNCRGSTLYIHEECLKKWILLKYDEKSNPHPSCEICQAEFSINPEFKRKFSFKNTTDSNYLACCIPISIFLVSFFAIISVFLNIFYKTTDSSRVINYIIIQIILALIFLSAIVVLIWYFVKNTYIKVLVGVTFKQNYDQETIK